MSLAVEYDASTEFYIIISNIYVSCHLANNDSFIDHHIRKGRKVDFPNWFVACWSISLSAIIVLTSQN